MSAESSEYHQDQTPRSIINYVVSTEVTDPSILESVADTVAGFISDVVPSSYTIPHDTTNQIQWAHFGPLEYVERELNSSTNYEKNSTQPLILVLGYKTGIQVWSVSANGLAAEVIPWRPGKTKVLRILPSPHKVDANCEDIFLSTRPLMALCDIDSATGACCTLDFVSLKTFKQVKSVKFRSNILDIQANKHSVVVSFSEKIVVLDAFTLRDRCIVAISPVIPASPITLGLRWLAYTEKTLVSTRKSGGGSDSEGVQSYTATMLECAKYISKGIKEFGESVANSFTGNANFKPGAVCPGSPQSPGKFDIPQKGIVTILDIECEQVIGREPLMNGEAIVAHFIAHNDPVASLKFDPSGMLLVTADVKGYDFHVFRIHPHPVGSSLASVHHLYILHRGDTSSRVQDMCFSPDSRWVTVSTRRGTTHVFPITPYGGPVAVRTHTTRHVVNKMSRYHRSAGLTGENRSNSPVSGSDSTTQIFPFTNPRFPPYPRPTVVNALAQIKQPSSIQTSGTVQLRSTNVTCPEDSICIAACFASPRDCIDQKSNKLKKLTPIESLFIIAYHGCLIQYDLEPCLARNLARERVCDDSPIELKTTPAAQWRLQRTPSSNDAQLHRKESYFEDIFSGVAKENVAEQSDDYWLSQVEIVTHAGPHRRLWMGPQFTFKTYIDKAGTPFSIANAQNIEIRRNNPVNMPIAQVISVDAELRVSRDFSPSLNAYHNISDEIEVVGDLQLEENLADALMESPGSRDSGVNTSQLLQDSPTVLQISPGFQEIGDEGQSRRDSDEMLNEYVVLDRDIVRDVNPLHVLRMDDDVVLEVPYYRTDVSDPILQKVHREMAENKLCQNLADALLEPKIATSPIDEALAQLQREQDNMDDEIINRAVAAEQLQPALIGSHEIGVAQIDVPMEKKELEQLKTKEKPKSEKELKKEQELKLEEKLKKPEELTREEELRKEEELIKEEELRREEEMRIERIKQKGREESYEQVLLDEFRKEQEETKKLELIIEEFQKKEQLKIEEVKRQEELRQQEKQRQEEKEAELKKEEELKMEKIFEKAALIIQTELKTRDELKKAEQIKRDEELKREQELKKEAELRKEEQLKKKAELVKEAELRKGSIEAQRKKQAELIEQAELRKEAELRMGTEFKKQDEMKRVDKLKKEAKSKKKKQLKDEELKMQDEFRRVEMLKTEAKLKREEELRKQPELKKEDELSRAEIIRKEVDSRREEILRNEAELRKQDELKGTENLKREAELKIKEEPKKDEKLSRKRKLKKQAELKNQDELKRAEEQRKQPEPKKQDELRGRGTLRKEEKSKMESKLRSEEKIKKKEESIRESVLRHRRMEAENSSTSSAKVTPMPKSKEGSTTVDDNFFGPSHSKKQGGRCVIVSMKPHATPVAKVVNPLGKVVTIQSDGETEKEQCEDAVIHENRDEALFRPILAPKPVLCSEGKPRSNPTDTMMVRSLDDTTEVMVKILDKHIHSNNPTMKEISRYSTETKYNDVPSIYKSNEHAKDKKNYQPDIIRIKSGDATEKDTPKSYNFSPTFEPESKHEISILDDMPPLENIDGALIFQESRDDLKDDFEFPYLDDKNDVDKELEFKTDMFEDASDCCDNLLYKNEENALCDAKKNSKTDVISEEKVVTAKTRKPKTKLGVRIPNKHFPTKNEDTDVWAPKNSWNSVTNAKPKEKNLDLSEKENCELLDVSDEKATKKSYTSAVKSVKLIHIETPADEEAAIEIVEPPLPEYRNNTWYPNILEKSSDDEKNIEGSPGETTESDDSGKLLENQVTEDFTSQCVIQTVSKTNKKKSKKKRK